MNITQQTIICSFALVVAVGCSRPATMPVAAKQEIAAPVEVEVVKVKARKLSKSLSVPASIEANATAPLMSYLQAYVDKVNVDIGDQVKAGQVLVELQTPELLEQVKRYEKAIEQCEAEVRLAEAELAAAESGLASQQAMLDLRDSELSRVDQLVEQGMLTEQRRDEAAFGKKSARAELTTVGNSVAVAAAKLDRSKSQVGVAKAELAEAEARANYRFLIAPFEGVITQRSVDPGVFVEPAGSGKAMPLITVSEISTLRAIIHLTRDDAPLAKLGSKATIQLGSSPNQSVPGILARSSGVFDGESRMMRAEIDIANPKGDANNPTLLAGGYGVANIAVRNVELPSAPASAVISSPAGAYVVKVDRNGGLSKWSVEIDIEDSGYVGFRSGVAEGDRILLKDANKYADQDKLTATIIER